MRFVPDGPDIPNELIRSWRSGKVLFLAGAGVSVPSGLPQFEELVLGVYERIGETTHTTLRAAKKLSSAKKRDKLFDKALLTPERRAEAALFFDKQFDRLFSALEKRVDPDLKGRAKFRNVREAVDELLSGGSPSASHRDLIRLSLSKNSFADPTKSHCCRIVTTNFDLLFEEGWAAELGTSPKSFDARVGPRPGSRGFEGVIHLHGLLQSSAGLESDYVLSSRDFARVYLRAGTIGNYIYDLIRQYRLVLIGYSADDPPMRYLMDAIGEDASLFQDMVRPYALTDLPPKASEVDAARLRAIWSTKEIEPLFFRRRAGKNSYSALWKSIGLWADWARSEMAWVNQQLLTKTAGRRRDASPFELAFVQDLLAVLEYDELESVLRLLNGKRVDFDWIETVDAALDEALTAGVSE
jgi:hypothetical protein